MKIGLGRIVVEPSANVMVTPMGTLTSRLKVGDRRPRLEAQLLQPDGTPQPLAGATVAFLARDARSRQQVISGAAVVVNPGDGTVRFDWGANDTLIARELEAWFVVTYSGGDVETFPNRDSHRVVIEP